MITAVRLLRGVLSVAELRSSVRHVPLLCLKSLCGLDGNVWLDRWNLVTLRSSIGRAAAVDDSAEHSIQHTLHWCIPWRTYEEVDSG
jgi:hypothetical protein